MRGSATIARPPNLRHGRHADVGFDLKTVSVWVSAAICRHLTIIDPYSGADHEQNHVESSPHRQYRAVRHSGRRLGCGIQCWRQRAPHVLVKFAYLNVASPEGATLYARIQMAAAEVCQPFDSRQFATQNLLKACVHKAIAYALNQVDQPALFSVYNARNGTKSIILASSTRLGSPRHRWRSPLPGTLRPV